MKTLTKFKGFKNVTLDKIKTFVGFNVKGFSNGQTAIAIDDVNKEVILKCACYNCGDISRIDLTQKQIKKINKILKSL